MSVATLCVQSGRGGICGVLPSGGVGAEIGVFRGEFSRVLAKRARPKRLYLIDPWWEVHGETFWFRPDLKTRDAYQATCDRMQWWLERQQVELVVKRSQEALAAMPDASLDWAYLDSSHAEAETLEELELLRRKVKPEGVIAGHDFNTRRHPGVFRAISQFLATQPQYELFYQDNFQQWAVRRRLQGATAA